MSILIVGFVLACGELVVQCIISDLTILLQLRFEVTILKLHCIITNESVSYLQLI